VIAVWVSLAAAVGAVLRYLLDRAVQHRHPSALPWGTFTINVSGSLLLGFVTGMALHHGWSSDAVSVLGTGLLGGYTTWSTFVWETVALAQDGRPRGAVLNVAGSLAVGLGAAAAGLGLALI
jgi:fluoride exporter